MTVSDLDQKPRAAALLARGLSTDKVGAEVGVSGRTVRRWREDPAFAADVREARREILGEITDAIAAASRDAVDTLREALVDKSPAIRVRAATALLGALPAVREHVDLAERIAEIEAAQEAGAA
ncbi:helix-turn-helix domain-containing protein [Streptomyces sp. IBSBF 2435]|uniref:helix-turn-helix domain-containing protein n=1 Tax=Streptomyces sp. IBSBF 2435 TaxID=2903531 RepID=UPI002FDBA5A0